MKQEGISQIGLAKAIGVPQPTIHQIWYGNVNPRDATIEKLGRHWNLSVHQMKYVDQSNPDAIDNDFRGWKVFMITAKMAALEKVPRGWKETITLHFKADDNAFGMALSDRGMEPRFAVNDIIVIDPGITLEPGRIVAARVAGYEAALVRFYRPLEGIHGKLGYELVPLNNYYPILRSPDMTIKILGVAVERREHLV